MFQSKQEYQKTKDKELTKKISRIIIYNILKRFH